MLQLDLSNDENQNFTTTLDNSIYEISIYSVGLTMACDIIRDEVSLVTGARITSGQFLLPYPATFVTYGNFLLLTEGFALPDYMQFGVTQLLIYYTPIEMAAVIAGTF